MAEVNVTINGRTFGIACDDGQEQRVLDLGKYVNERLKDISQAGAANNETHLMVLTSLVLADEVFDLLDSEGNADNSNKNSALDSTIANGIPAEDEQKYVNAIDYLTGRIDDISGLLQKAS